MIPRTLVPLNVRPVNKDEARKAPSRTTTYMDDRTVVPSGVSDAPPLDGKTTIPSHLPLGVLVDRTLVPRGMAAKPGNGDSGVRGATAIDDEKAVRLHFAVRLRKFFDAEYLVEHDDPGTEDA